MTVEENPGKNADKKVTAELKGIRLSWTDSGKEFFNLDAMTLTGMRYSETVRLEDMYLQILGHMNQWGYTLAGIEPNPADKIVDKK